MLKHLTLAIATASLLLPAGAAVALSSGVYDIGGPAQGNSPFAGLGLAAGNAGTSGSVDFSAAGSGTFLAYDASQRTVRIFARGVIGGGSASPSFYDVGFVYRDIAPGSGATPSGLVASTAGSPPQGPGRGNDINLVNFGGNHGSHFYIGLGQLGSPQQSGWGSMDRQPTDFGSRRASSDWLFEVGNPVPEPSAALAFGIGALFLAGCKRR